MDRELLKKENYKKLKDAGFSVSEANHFKSRSRSNIDEMVKLRAIYDILNTTPKNRLDPELWDICYRLHWQGVTPTYVYDVVIKKGIDFLLKEIKEED